MYYGRIITISTSSRKLREIRKRNPVTLSALMNAADDDEYKCYVKLINWLHCTGRPTVSSQLHCVVTVSDLSAAAFIE